MPAEASIQQHPASVKVHRTVPDILSRIEEFKSSGDDFLGFQRSDLIDFLPFSEARAFLKPQVTSDGWKPKVADESTIKALMLEYMPFAWGKANNCRGLSAGRSLDHMRVWLWMLGDDLEDRLDDYTHYGKPQLRAICEKYGWDWEQWDDGCWRNSEDDDGVAAADVRALT